MNQSFVTDNLNIYASFSYNIIFLKITNNLIFANYELTIYESNINDNKFKIDQLYTFIIKSLKKEDNHSFTCNIMTDAMKISMNATLNSYFKLNYEITLEKKLELKINESKFDESKIIELRTELNILKNNYQLLNEMINTIEISIGYFKYDTNKTIDILSILNNDILNIKLLAKKTIPIQIIIYFSKIKKLLKLQKIFISNNIPIILYDDNDTIINNLVLDEYCKKNNIEILII
jgi:hypothetical protein